MSDVLHLLVLKVDDAQRQARSIGVVAHQRSKIHGYFLPNQKEYSSDFPRTAISRSVPMTSHTPRRARKTLSLPTTPVIALYSLRKCARPEVQHKPLSLNFLEFSQDLSISHRPFSPLGTPEGGGPNLCPGKTPMSAIFRAYSSGVLCSLPRVHLSGSFPSLGSTRASL